MQTAQEPLLPPTSTGIMKGVGHDSKSQRAIEKAMETYAPNMRTRGLEAAPRGLETVPRGLEAAPRGLGDAFEVAQAQVPKLAKLLANFEPIFGQALVVLEFVAELYVRIYSKFYEVYKSLPVNQLQAVIGIILCFFGGFFCTLIAAVEAFYTMGGEVLYDEISYVTEQAKLVWAANKEDQKADANRDGVIDVEQMDMKQLAGHKLRIALLCVDDPAKLQAAVGALWSAFLGVLATLKLEFAQTTAFALGLAKILKFPATRLLASPLVWALGPKLVHWTDTIIDSALKIVLIMLVWIFARVRAAFYSGIRGGKMFGIAVMQILEEKKLTESLPDFICKKPYIPEESYLDEIIGFPIAAMGIYFQLRAFCTLLPFPLDWILWPVSIAEYVLELQVSWS